MLKKRKVRTFVKPKSNFMTTEFMKALFYFIDVATSNEIERPNNFNYHQRITYFMTKCYENYNLSGNKYFDRFVDYEKKLFEDAAQIAGTIPINFKQTWLKEFPMSSITLTDRV
jgi:hypothetical protein